MSDYFTYPQCTDEYDGRNVFDDALMLLENESSNFALRFIKDTGVRAEYISKAQALSLDYLDKINNKILSPYEAAEEVNALRNEIMEAARLKSSDLGRAKAIKLKGTGKTLEELCEHYAKRLYNRNFTSLSKIQQNQVYKEIVKAAGRTRPGVNANLRMASRLGKGLIALTLVIAVYNVATADDKLKAAGKEGVVIGGGLMGGALGGAAAGLACGPGAPVCVTIGIFVGGALGGLGSDTAFDYFF